MYIHLNRYLDKIQIKCFLIKIDSKYWRKQLFLPNQLVLIIKKLKKMAYVISDDCIACGTCIDECPVEAISEGDKYSINPDLCTECGTCADACPSEAIHLG